MKKISNLLAPAVAVIRKVSVESASIKSFELEFLDKKLRKKFRFLPGKFAEISVFGFGEMPISIASSPLQKKTILFTVNNVGNISAAMHKLKKGDSVGLRGPYGNGFPFPTFTGKNIIAVAGGCGFAGLHSVIETAFLQRAKFGQIDIFYGARSESDLIYKKDIADWKKKKINIHLSVDANGGKKFFTGFVHQLMEKTVLEAKNSIVVFCGPGRMTESCVEVLKAKGFSEKQMFLSLERLMHCGMGKCAHCNMGQKFVCIDGPVFQLDELKELPWKKE